MHFPLSKELYYKSICTPHGWKTSVTDKILNNDLLSIFCMDLSAKSPWNTHSIVSLRSKTKDNHPLPP